MTQYKIAELLKKLGVRETKAETYPNTYSFVSGSSFLAQQVNNRDSASWKKAEYIILTESNVSEGILNGWKKLTERDPLPSAIQKLCVPRDDDQFDVYDSQGNLIKTSSLDTIIQHTPDIIDVLNYSAEETSPSDTDMRNSNTHESSFTPSQIIYYGVPGCGKSNTIKEMLKNVPDEQKERVVFHPEYTNADFVGQVLPVVNNGVTYDFVVGPFTKMIAKAYKSLASDNPQMHYLVIEEINRGNAAAIFGDVFQLLDRIKPGETDESLGNGNVYTAGWSQYFVYNEDVNAKILKLAGVSELTMKGITFTKDTGIRLPPNLSILATMNTSDQNVFTLDNAFRRRFDSELVKNTLEGDEHKLQRETKIQDTGVTWGDFWMRINELILEKHSSMSNSEDKRLGAYFVVGEKKEENGEVYREISKKLFGEKVLEYLWDDAFKYKRKDIFQDNCKSVETLIEKFEEGGFKAVFKNLGL